MSSLNTGHPLVQIVEPKNALVRPGDLISGDMTITRDDAVNYMVSKISRRLRDARTQLESELKSTLAKINDGEAKLRNVGTDLATKQKLNKLEAAAKALKEAGLIEDYEVRATLSGINEQKQIFTSTVGIYGQRGDQTALNRQIEIPFNADAKKILDQLDQYRLTLKAKDEQLAETRKKLAEVPDMVLDAKAALAETVLSKTQDGAAYMERIESRMADYLPEFLQPALPAPNKKK